MSYKMEYEITRTDDVYVYKFMTKPIEKKSTNCDADKVPIELLVLCFMTEMASRHPMSSIIFEVRMPDLTGTRSYDIRWVTRFPNEHISEDSLKLIETFISDLEYNHIILDGHPNRKKGILTKMSNSSFETNLVKIELVIIERMSLMHEYLYKFETCGISKEIIQIALSGFLKTFPNPIKYNLVYKEVSDYIESLSVLQWSKAYTLNLAHLALMTNPHLHHPYAHYLDLYKTTMDHEAAIGKVGRTLSTLAEKQLEIMQEISNTWRSSTADVGKIIAKIELEGGIYDVN